MAYGEAVQRLNPCDNAMILSILNTVVEPPFSLLDIGCGRGERLNAIAEAFPGAKLFGIDSDIDNCYMAAAGCPKAHIIHGNAQILPMASASFSVALCECTLSLLADPFCCLSEISRVLFPGGYLILSDLYLPESTTTRLSLSSEGFVRSLASKGWHEQIISLAGFSVLSFHDCKEELLAYVAQMIFDGSFGCVLSHETAAALKRFHASYGLWVLKKEGSTIGK